MSTTITINGTTYTVPAVDETSWGQNVTDLLAALGTALLQKGAGADTQNFTLAGPVDFGATYGISIKSITSKSASSATAGMVRLAEGDTITWKSSGVEYPMTVTGANLTYNGKVVATVDTVQTLINKTLTSCVIDADLNTITNITNDEIKASAAIDGTKISPDFGSQNITTTGDASVAGLTVTDLNVGIAHLDSDGVMTSSLITDLDVHIAAAIDQSKIKDLVDDLAGKEPTVTKGNIGSNTDGVNITGGTAAVIGSGVVVDIDSADATHDGLLTKEDWNRFDAAAPDALSDIVTATTGVTITANDGSVISASDISIDIDTADVDGPGLLSAADWSTFNGKQDALGFTPVNKAGDTMEGLLELDTEGLQFNTSSTPPTLTPEGSVWWNSDDHTLNLKSDVAAATLQLGLENWLRARNDTAAIIPEGSVVYISGANTARAQVSLARANSAATSDKVIGVATHNIAIGALGIVTTFGLVRDINTSVDGDGQSLADGDPIYLSASTAGEWVKTKPHAPNHCVKIGQVVNAAAGNNGSIFISLSAGSHLADLHDVNVETSLADRDTLEYDSALGYWKNRADVTQYTLEKTGFVDPHGLTVSYNSTTRKVTITHATEIIYLCKNKKISLGASFTTPTAHDNTLDKRYYLYFDEAGTAVWVDTFPGFDNGAYAAQIDYYTNYKFGIRECHGLMDWQTWEWLHRNQGTYKLSGGAVTGIVIDSSTSLDNLRPAVAEAVVVDEDLPSTVPALTDNSTYMRVHFENGEAVFTSDVNIFPQDATNMQYNSSPITGTALTSMGTNNRWVNVYGCAVPVTADAESQAYRFLWFLGQVQHTSLAAAQAETFLSLYTGDLTSILPEIVPITQITFKRTTSAGATYNVQVDVAPVAITGTRASLLSVSGAVPTSHAGLLDRSLADQHPAAAITNSPSGSLAANNVQAALNELQSDVDSRAPSSTAVTLTGTQVLTNKDIDGGTASDTSRITVPKAAKATLDGLTRKEGTLVYASDLDTLFADNGSALVPVGSSSSTGEKNYITNSSAALAITGWTNVGDLDVARTTTAAELPREFTTASGIKITADANTQSVADYVYYDFSLDDVDLNKKLKITWSQKMTGTYASGDLAVVITTQADRTTALHTPVTTNIPNVDGVFTTSFDAGSTATLSLVIRATADMATDGGLVISDVVVGPGSIVTGAVVGDWLSYTPTISNGFTTPANTEFWYRRVGDSLECRGSFTFAGAAGNEASITVPTGLTLNTAYLQAGSRARVGKWTCNSNATALISSADKEGDLFSDDADTSKLFFAAQVGTAGLVKNNPTGWTSNAAGVCAVNFTVPIAEWAGSGTVNLAQNDVEYASVGGTWDNASSTTVYGPAGQPIGGTLTAGQTKTITWQTPIQTGDVIQVEGSRDGILWAPLNGFSFSSGSVIPSLNAAADAAAGSSWYHSSTTQTVVTFSRYMNMANDDSPATNWPSSSAYWRVRKTSAGAAVGFGEVVPGTSAGLVSMNGLKGNTTGNAIAAGYVGEQKRTAYVNVATSTTTVTNITSLDITKGVWIIRISGNAVKGSATGLDVAINVANNSMSGQAGEFSQAACLNGTGSAFVFSVSAYINVSSDTTYYCNAQSSGAASGGLYGIFEAIRIA